MLKAIKQYQLIDKDCSQGESSCVDQPFGRNLTVNVKDALELPIEVLYGQRTQLVEDWGFKIGLAFFALGSLP